MALFRRLFYRKPPDRLLEITERVYVFDCCFSSEIMEEEEYRDYLDGIVAQLQTYFPEASFMVFNFREGERKNQISEVLLQYDITVINYPQQYVGCPVLPFEIIQKFLRACDSWLSFGGEQNVLLMHCERGGWPVLSFMLAGLLLYKKQYTEELRTLDLVYKQAPKELLHLSSPLDPQSSHVRYLHYVSQHDDDLEEPLLDMPFTLLCLVLRLVPNFDGEGGCRPLVRVYGQDPLMPIDGTPKLLFSTFRTKEKVRYVRQADSSAIKLDVQCCIQGDVVLECIHMDENLEHEEIMFRVMFNTAFVKSNVMLLDHEEVDVLWKTKDHFVENFKAEVHFSEFDVGSGTISEPVILDDDETECGSTEEFFEAEEIFSSLDWSEGQRDPDLQMVAIKTALQDGSHESVLGLLNPEVEATGRFEFSSSDQDLDILSSSQQLAITNNRKLMREAFTGKFVDSGRFDFSSSDQDLDIISSSQQLSITKNRKLMRETFTGKFVDSGNLKYDKSLYGESCTTLNTMNMAIGRNTSSLIRDESILETSAIKQEAVDILAAAIEDMVTSDTSELKQDIKGTISMINSDDTASKFEIPIADEPEFKLETGVSKHDTRDTRSDLEENKCTRDDMNSKPETSCVAGESMSCKFDTDDFIRIDPTLAVLEKSKLDPANTGIHTEDILDLAGEGQTTSETGGFKQHIQDAVVPITSDETPHKLTDEEVIRMENRISGHAIENDFTGKQFIHCCMDSKSGITDSYGTENHKLDTDNCVSDACTGVIHNIEEPSILCQAQECNMVHEMNIKLETCDVRDAEIDTIQNKALYQHIEPDEILTTPNKLLSCCDVVLSDQEIELKESKVDYKEETKSGTGHHSGVVSSESSSASASPPSMPSRLEGVSTASFTPCPSLLSSHSSEHSPLQSRRSPPSPLVASLPIQLETSSTSATSISPLPPLETSSTFKIPSPPPPPPLSFSMSSSNCQRSSSSLSRPKISATICDPLPSMHAIPSPPPLPLLSLCSKSSTKMLPPPLLVVFDPLHLPVEQVPFLPPVHVTPSPPPRPSVPLHSRSSIKVLPPPPPPPPPRLQPPPPSPPPPCRVSASTVPLSPAAMPPLIPSPPPFPCKLQETSTKTPPAPSPPTLTSSQLPSCPPSPSQKVTSSRVAPPPLSRLIWKKSDTPSPSFPLAPQSENSQGPPMPMLAGISSPPPPPPPSSIHKEHRVPPLPVLPPLSTLLLPGTCEVPRASTCVTDVIPPFSPSKPCGDGESQLPSAPTLLQAYGAPTPPPPAPPPPIFTGASSVLQRPLFGSVSPAPPPPPSPPPLSPITCRGLVPPVSSLLPSSLGAPPVLPLVKTVVPLSVLLSRDLSPPPPPRPPRLTPGASPLSSPSRAFEEGLSSRPPPLCPAPSVLLSRPPPPPPPPPQFPLGASPLSSLSKAFEGAPPTSPPSPAPASKDSSLSSPSRLNGGAPASPPSPPSPPLMFSLGVPPPLPLPSVAPTKPLGVAPPPSPPLPIINAPPPSLSSHRAPSPPPTSPSKGPPPPPPPPPPLGRHGEIRPSLLLSQGDEGGTPPPALIMRVPPPPPPPVGNFRAPPPPPPPSRYGESAPPGEHVGPPPPPPPPPLLPGGHDGAPPPPPLPGGHSSVPPPPPLPGGHGSAPPPPPLPGGHGSAPPPPPLPGNAPYPPPLPGGYGGPPPPPPLPGGYGGAPPPPLLPGGHGSAPPPPPLPGSYGGAPPPPPLPGGHGSAPPPPPLPGGHGSAPPPPPLPGGHGCAPPPPPFPAGHGEGPPRPPPPGSGAGPPAPPGAPGVPPPPLGGGRGSLGEVRGQGLGRTTALGVSNSSRKSSLKPLHWVKVSRALQGSLWAELQKHADTHSNSEFDVSEIETLFSAVVKKPNNSKSDGQKSQKSDKVHLIDLRRANNTEIMLTKIKMPLPDMMSAALALDDSLLDADQVENLIKFCPTKEEMELLKGYTGNKETLGKCEQFFMELMKVPRVESKLRVFSFKIQFSSQIKDIRQSLNNINSACEQIRNSDKLKEIMKKILYLGNTLNQGTARGAAVGFRLDSLLKLTDTRATNNKMTLMHYLCKVLASKSSDLLDFHEELTSLEAASKIQLKLLAEEQQAIVKGLEKVELELSASERDGPVSEVFCKTLKEFTAVAGADVGSITTLYTSTSKNADGLAVYFGEDPARCPFEQVITTLLNFVRLFRNAHEENCKNAELEKKKALKEAEMEKSGSPMKKKGSFKEAEMDKSGSPMKRISQKEAETDKSGRDKSGSPMKRIAQQEAEMDKSGSPMKKIAQQEAEIEKSESPMKKPAR